MLKIISTTLALIMLLTMVAGCAKEPVPIESNPTEVHNQAETEPTEKLTTVSTKPSEPAEEPTKATEPDKDKDPAKEPTKPTEPTSKPTEATKPTEPKPTTPATKPTEPKPTTPPHQHNYHGDTVNATCIEGGYTKYTCSCGNSYTGNEVVALGHEYKSEVVNATYEAGGYTKFTCNRCGHYYEDNRTAPLSKPTEATTPTEPQPTTPPTESTQPTVPVICSYCGGAHELAACPKAEEDRNKEPEAVACGMCGSTDCEYPKTGDATKCKNYDDKYDPTKYCQSCGKPASTCKRWTVDKVCPNCGTSVPARTCHYC